MKDNEVKGASANTAQEVVNKKTFPEKVIEAKNNGFKILKLSAIDDDGKEIEFYFRKPNKAEFKMNLDKVVSGQINSAGKSFSLVSHMENTVKRQIVYPTIDELTAFLDSNLSCIPDFYSKLFGEDEKKLDFLSTEI